MDSGASHRRRPGRALASDGDLHHLGRLGWLDPPNVETWVDGSQFRYGTRVGCLVLSPYARRGYISRVLHSHVSLVKFCETTFGLTHLNFRDAAADDMSDCFDFSQPPAPPPNFAASTHR
ncbi:MAG: hypothetical protein E6H01_10880 [Bacillati bacterium ANGP1]|uniref:Uncharacterized protein n=1 Tax=Candidatus Segetimicrobium genomatis TaxID=2569760 RepID=A0A537KUT8_9BACT|nr:MAG: hypothetical protein E6H01_10880 [Terrabacteria group bacterium ANGP1]